MSFNAYATLFILAMIFLMLFKSKLSAAAFMFSIALSAAGQLGVNAMPFIVTLMISASCAFISLAGYQTNLMVWEPGKYEFTDFVKSGTP